MKGKLLGRVAVVGGVAITAGIVVFAVRGGGGTTPSGFDYNCDLPGIGYPWLEHWDTIVPVEGGGEEQLWTWEDPTGSAGYYDAPDGIRFFLPVRVDDDGEPLDVLDVYRTLCRTHPDLGGGGLRRLTHAELEPLLDCFVGLESDNWPIFTDGARRGLDEAHMCYEEVRVYGLPDISPQLAAELSTEVEAPAAAATSTTVGANEQTWQIECIGYEVDEMDPRWRETTGIRGAIRFDYRLEGAFKTSEDDGRVRFAGGTVTGASISLSDLYGPAGTWELGPVNCIGCSAIGPGSPLAGTILPANEIVLDWGAFRPAANVDARVVRSCTPMPGCAEWKSRYYISDTFYHRLSALGLILQDGFVGSDRVTSPQGDTWVDFTCTLHGLIRLPAPTGA